MNGDALILFKFLVYLASLQIHISRAYFMLYFISMLAVCLPLLLTMKLIRKKSFTSNTQGFGGQYGERIYYPCRLPSQFHIASLLQSFRQLWQPCQFPGSWDTLSSFQHLLCLSQFSSELLAALSCLSIVLIKDRA